MLEKEDSRNTFVRRSPPAASGFSIDRENVGEFWEREKAVRFASSISKRVFDIAVSSLMLAVLFPAIVLISFLIKIDSKGSVFYSQVRVGRNRRTARDRRAGQWFVGMLTGDAACPDDGRRLCSLSGRCFRILKFRSMRADAEREGGAVWCRARDPRVTRVGDFLRRTHLDEIPQLINVLLGDMTLVGPRPERPEFVSDLRKSVSGYERRLFLKPGLTGLAQIRHRADRDLADVKRKLRYDRFYLRRASLAADIKILLGTIPCALGVSVETMRSAKRFRRALTSGWVFGLLNSAGRLRNPFALK